MTDEDEIPRPRNEIVVYNYERKQLLDFIPQIIEHYESMNVEENNTVDDVIELCESLQTIFSEEPDGHKQMYDIGADAWEDLSVGLDEIDGDKSNWLRSKLAKRAELPITHMGFGTPVPFMSMYVDETPKRPDRTA